MVVESSTDLVHWKVPAKNAVTPTADIFPVVAAGPAGFVAFVSGRDACDETGVEEPRVDPAQGQAWTSQDGVAWKQSKVSFKGCIAEAVGGPHGIVAFETMNPQSVAVDTLWYSETGESWQTVSFTGPEFKDAQIMGLFSTPAGFEMTGYVGPDQTMAAWWSADGRKWHRAQIGASQVDPYFTQIDALSYGMVAYPDDRAGQLWFSTDGHAWSFLPETNKLWQAFFADLTLDGSQDVSTARGGFGRTILLDANGDIWETADGNTWRQIGTKDELPGPYEGVFLTAKGLGILFDSPSDGSPEVSYADLP